MNNLPDLVLFGPQNSYPTPDTLTKTRQTLLNVPAFTSFLQSITSLPVFWLDLIAVIPDLQRVPGSRILTALKSWVETGDLPISNEDERLNVLLTPLTVIVQISQYLQCISRNTESSVIEIPDIVQPKPKVQGFCIGLLAAAAVSCTDNLLDLSRLASISLRLAICIGAIVDLDGKFSESPEQDEVICLVAGGNSEGEKDLILRIVAEDQIDAYISVLKGPKTFTLTVKKSHGPHLTQRLIDSGFSSTPLSLEGRFHTRRHEKMLAVLQTFCSSRADLQLPSSSKLLVPLRSSADGSIIAKDAGYLHDIILRWILVNVCNWDRTIKESVSDLSLSKSRKVVILSQINFVPLKLARDHCLETQVWNSNSNMSKSISPIPESISNSSFPSDSIAIIGMSCRLPGAPSVEDFWTLLASGDSMVSDIPSDRFSTKDLRRTLDSNTRYWGNFLDNVHSFDHAFFKKSPREAASMDPQQRLALEVAYEALESSGYFAPDAATAHSNSVGVYLGVGSVDYHENVTSHKPNAFSALGTLRAFISGNISHNFGWTGPSITYDTACSSSAVAIHSACKALQNGECEEALAGGVNVITSPVLFQNLSAASFLSPSGASKAFDASADGYCRGEGCALFVLKKLSKVTTQDKVLAVITGSAINQSSNSTPITVPHSSSQSKLYEQVLAQSGIDAYDISYVEAHGTGTPIGDPIEADSIRRVFGGPERKQKLYLGSIKSNIGHLEAASGAAALIKSVLMIQKGLVPKQANFVSLNPRINPLSPDKMEIPDRTQLWDSRFRAVCINNYGAAGSNAALIVCQYPERLPPTSSTSIEVQTTPPKELFHISADSMRSLKKFCSNLRVLIAQEESREPQSKSWLGSLAFNLAHKQNHTLRHSFITTAISPSDLLVKLQDVDFETERKDERPLHRPVSLPVVLCFGGQTSTNIGLSEELYNTCNILRTSLDRCDRICRSLDNGLATTIYPYIFSKESIEDMVHLHCSLFALQYACAQAWIESGVKVASLIGHSFGQLTALCISGVLSLRDSLQFVATRASLIQKKWGAEKGSMISIEASLDVVQKIISIALAKDPANRLEIACHNGPKSFVLVGSEEEIKVVQTIIADSTYNFGAPLSSKRLGVSHGFHSRFLDVILPDLLAACRNFVFHNPKIPIETCSEDSSWTEFTPENLATHSRQPVFFAAAIERIKERLGPSIWLEAGSASTITNMARKILTSNPELKDAPDVFLAERLNGIDAREQILVTTISLRKAGVRSQFWLYHHSQRVQYQNMNLPSYQWDQARHWLDYKDLVENVNLIRPSFPREVGFEELVRFAGVQDSSGLIIEFEVNPLSRMFQNCADGHSVLGNSLCPISLYMEIIATAIRMQEGPTSFDHLLRIESLNIRAPLGVDDRRSCHLKMTRSDTRTARWDFVLSSKSKSCGDETQHATGIAFICIANEPALTAERITYQRLVNLHRCQKLLDDNNAESMRGSLIYSTFDRVVKYKDYYRGVKGIAAKNNEVAGIVCMPMSSTDAAADNHCNPLAIDNFLQVAGLHVNILKEHRDDEIFVCTSIRSSQIYSNLNQTGLEKQSWTVYSQCEVVQEKLVENDIFVFDSTTGLLVMTLLGVRFSKLSARVFERVLSSVNADFAIKQEEVSGGKSLKVSGGMSTAALSVISRKEEVYIQVPAHQSAKLIEIFENVRRVLGALLGISAQEIQKTSHLQDLGIDSLLTTEVLVDIREEFGVSIPPDTLKSFTTIISLSEYLHRVTRSNSESSSNDNGYFSDDSKESETTIPDGETSFLKPQIVPAHRSYAERLEKLLSEHLLLPESVPWILNLNEAGMDSLISMEVQSDIKEEFGVSVNLNHKTLTFGELLEMVSSQKLSKDSFNDSSEDRDEVDRPRKSPNPQQGSLEEVKGSQEDVFLHDILRCFAEVENDYERYASLARQTGFYSHVYPQQTQLVTAYVVEAFEKLGCSLASMGPGQPLEKISYSSVHERVMSQIYGILEDASLIMMNPAGGFLRTTKKVDTTPSMAIHTQLLFEFPDHASEHNLLNITGSKLAECLTGSEDPLRLIFGSKANKQLLENVYTCAPMFATGTIMLTEFILKLLKNGRTGSGPVYILEVGGGTGGTTKAVLETLKTNNVQFEYCFTDISASLVHDAKRKFSHFRNMDFMVLDVETQPPSQLLNKFHLVISTNCIHATKNLVQSTANIHKMLRKDGVFCLLELTKNLPWFDLVFGLLDGWWRFEDGRKHALADEKLWKKNLMNAGFSAVNWTKGTSEESRQLRLIVACKSKAEFESEPKVPSSSPQVESLLFGEENGVSLYADVYYQAKPDPVGLKRPVALMIHGGGHIMLSRYDIRPSQTQLLLDHGLLPVSIDYRLCPEVTLLEGPMTDACSALSWAQTILPTFSFKNPTIQADGSKIVAIGWSTGGHLAMSLAWMAPQRGIKPPTAILAFYCPTDYSDDFWKKPNFPHGTTAEDTTSHRGTLLEGLQEVPITQYNVPVSKQPIGGWFALSDARSRIALHMNWAGQSLPILFGSMRSEAKFEMTASSQPIFPQPSSKEIASINPRAQINQGAYQTPTYLVHGTKDDLIPWQHTQGTYQCLLEAQIEAGMAIVPEAIHLFDLRGERDEQAWPIVQRAYEFLFTQLRRCP